MPDSYRSPAELQELITEMEHHVQDLEEPRKYTRAVEDGTFDYLPEIPDELATSRTGPKAASNGKVTFDMRNLTKDFSQLSAAVSWPYRIAVDFPRGGPRSQRDSDDLEVLWGHSLIRADPDGSTKQTLHDDSIADTFGALWPYVVDTPKCVQRRGESSAVYERRKQMTEAMHWRWMFKALPPSTVSFLDHDGRPTCAGVRMKMPAIDMMNLYHEEKEGESQEDRSPWVMINSPEFAYLRLGMGYNPEQDSQASLTRKSVTLYVVNDGKHECHYLDLSEAGNGQKGYHEVKSYDNTLGEVPLILFTGHVRRHNDMKTRYEGLGSPYAKAMHDINLQWSLIWTMIANRRWVAPLGPEWSDRIDISKLWDGGKLEFKQGHMPTTPSELQDVSNAVPPEVWKALEGAMKVYDDLRAPLSLLTPSPDTLEKAGVGSILWGSQAGLQPFGPTIKAGTSGMERMFKMFAHDGIYGLNPHMLTVGESERHDKHLEFAATGAEWSRSAVKKGQKLKISPSLLQDFLESGVISVEAVPDTDATRAARAKQAMEELMAPRPTATIEDVLEAKGEHDVTGKLEKLATDQRYQLTAPMRINMYTMDAIREIALRDERDEQALMALVMPNVQVDDGTGQGGKPPSSGFTYNQPAGGSPPTGASLA